MAKMCGTPYQRKLKSDKDTGVSSSGNDNLNNGVTSNNNGNTNRNMVLENDCCLLYTSRCV